MVLYAIIYKYIKNNANYKENYKIISSILSRKAIHITLD